MPSEHYFSERPTTPAGRRVLQAVLRGLELRLVTAAGVFSRDGVDPGTRLLVEHMAVHPGERFLDLGCGYGVIGIVAAMLAPDGRITLVDTNQRAVELARENIRVNRIGNAEVWQGDGFAPVVDHAFDVIATNPPIRAGLRVVHRLIEEAQEHLAPGGLFYLVARARQGAVRISEKMGEVFGNVAEVARGGGYRLYLSRRSPR